MLLYIWDRATSTVILLNDKNYREKVPSCTTRRLGREEAEIYVEYDE